MGTLKVRVNDAWEVVGGDVSEMLVSDVDPYVLDAAATEELWYSPVVKQLFARVNNAWQPAVINEVMISRNDPAVINPEVELWYDTDATPSFPSTKPVAIDEVWIGAQEPLKPGVELWYDTTASLMKARINSAWVPITTPPELPLGGLTNEALVKSSAADQETRWGGALEVSGTLNVVGVASFQENINLGGGDQIQFPNETGPKINLYSTTFGLGVESGETSIFASSKVGFHANASNGTKWAEIDANGLGPRQNYNVSWLAGFTGSAQFRVNPAMVTLSLWHFVNGVELLSYQQVKIFDYPAGVPAPWMNVSGAVAPQWMGGTAGYIPLRIDCMADGVWCYPNDYFGVGDLWEAACTVTWAR